MYVGFTMGRNICEGKIVLPLRRVEGVRGNETPEALFYNPVSRLFVICKKKYNIITHNNSTQVNSTVGWI